MPKIQFKPWPLPHFLINLAALAVLFVLGSLLPGNLVSAASLIAGGLTAMTMAYLSFCGYSIWYVSFRTRLVLLAVYFTMLVSIGALATLLLKT